MGTGTGTPVIPAFALEVPVDNWLTHIWPNVPYCPNPTIREAILDACREFLRETELWTVEAEPIDIIAGEPEYWLITYSGDLVSLDHIEILQGGKYRRRDVISEIAIDENPDERDDWRAQESDDPQAGYVDQALHIKLTYVPNYDLVAGLKAWVNIMPYEDAELVPQILWTHYKEVIEVGALARLQAIVGVPWNNPQEAQNNGAAFASSYLKARQKKFSGFTRHRTRDIIRSHYTDF